MATSVDTWPIFVHDDDDKVRWKASLDLTRLMYGLNDHDGDFLNGAARLVFESDFSTNELRGLSPDAPPDQPVVDAPSRFTDVQSDDPRLMRAAMAAAQKLEWSQESGFFKASINSVSVYVEGTETPAKTVAARLVYLLSPVPENVAGGLSIYLHLGENPSTDGDDDTALVTCNDLRIDYWNFTGTLNESVFDFVVARSLLSQAPVESYDAVQTADVNNSQQAALSYQKKGKGSLQSALGDTFLIGAPEISIFSRGQGSEADFNESFAWWLGSQRTGLLGRVRYKSVYPARDKAFSEWK